MLQEILPIIGISNTKKAFNIKCFRQQEISINIHSGFNRDEAREKRQKSFYLSSPPSPTTKRSFYRRPHGLRISDGDRYSTCKKLKNRPVAFLKP